MRRLSPARQAGVTLIELMIGLAIMGFTLAVGVPSMSHWMQTNRAKGAAEFYADGLATARRQALSHNARSRFVLSEHAGTGQYNWQVDVCFPQPDAPCSSTTGSWSSAAAPAANDPQGENGYKSVYRSAAGLPPSSVIAPVLEPAGAREIYFTELGWVDATGDERVSSIRLHPGSQFQGEVPPVSLVVTLSGMTAKCDPTRSAGDSRACPE
ncbi:MAG: prepilin-type N-terminal cleavage/methylation protein [Pseudoduganella sp.]|jgi:type IV fimbrial biogenesis protein FimT|nr:prepilin-type N-terminal cleavage/methylation protein [Pseudoduganella sp.]